MFPHRVSGMICIIKIIMKGILIYENYKGKDMEKS